MHIHLILVHGNHSLSPTDLENFGLPGGRKQENVVKAGPGYVNDIGDSDSDQGTHSAEFAEEFCVE